MSYKLKSYDKVIERRREIAQMYQDRLGSLEEVQLPPSPDRSPYNFDVYQNYEIQADNRDDLKNYLNQNHVGTLIQWGGKGIHHFKQLGFNQFLPKTDQFFKRCIMIPMNTFISNGDVDYICDKIIDFYKK